MRLLNHIETVFISNNLRKFLTLHVIHKNIIKSITYNHSNVKKEMYLLVSLIF